MVPVFLCPLQELQVVLHLALHKRLGRQRTIDSMFAESVGQDLEVLKILVFGGCIELDTAHGKIEEDAVVDLA